MSAHDGLPLRLACYAAGAAALSLAGPALWAVTGAVAATAAIAAGVCFAVADVLFSTHRLARRAFAATAYHKAEVAALSARVAGLEARRPAAEPAPPIIEKPDVSLETANNLLQFAAHVSARCGRQAEPEIESGRTDAPEGDPISDAQIELHLQPIVGISDRRVLHYEALTRLRSRTGTLMMPAEFLPVARASGRAAELDTRQLSSIVGLCHRIGDRHMETRLFCNLSGDSLQSAAFRASLAGFARAQKALSPRIVFEIDAATATALSAEAVADLRGVEAMGFAFSVDNVALGDIARLQGIFRRPGFLKMEAAMLADADPNVLKALARGGTQVIATHVETEQHALSVRRSGVELGQGFLFGKPRPARMDDSARRAA
ncbi:EAL domain-containing protein [Sphingosinicella soli]|uniref:EAL domain-containing protein (Putative c-di-GMP-specific phosphodiesterase class I) n=1 Tax=Sphingosinicella soli TaxID=333708 RepID=A0A7W7F7P2_9SPHN|nr:EAL domain-containing protein [Sphingosinicella soli]MBB4633651.1 EAL domain-containing protein (putative c-di-GMP-specific phosphodiesterase class I) [Sphingosinicella soli]